MSVGTNPAFSIKIDRQAIAASDFDARTRSVESKSVGTYFTLARTSINLAVLNLSHDGHTTVLFREQISAVVADLANGGREILNAV